MRLADLPLTLPEEDVLRRLGYPRGRVPPTPIRARLGVVLGEARVLAAPRGVWKVLPAFLCGSVGLAPVDARRLVLGLATVGPAPERRAAELLRGGDSLGALLLDAAASAAVEETADRVCENAVTTLSEPGAADPAGVRLALRATGEFVLTVPHLVCRISPGYPGWKLESQRALFDVLPAAELGVELLPSYLMSPRKSVSFALWLGAGGVPLAGLSGCARCELPGCRHRRPAPAVPAAHSGAVP